MHPRWKGSVQTFPVPVRRSLTLALRFQADDSDPVFFRFFGVEKESNNYHFFCCIFNFDMISYSGVIEITVASHPLRRSFHALLS